MKRHNTLLTLILVLGIGTVMAVAVVPVADQNKIAELINQLGSQNFRQRDAATKELDAIGEAALEALRKAATNPDMEIANRATELVAKIEARNENARLLAPTYVELSLKEVSVDYAVAELAKKSGYSIVLGGDKSKLADRRVTLETGNVPFWKALEMLCEKADLCESDVAVANTVVSPSAPTTGPIRVRPINPAPPPVLQPVQVQPAQPPMPVQRKVIATTGIARQPVGNAPTIVLVDGKANTAPTFVDGAVRVRSLHNAELQARYGPIPEGEIDLLLEVKPEPKIQIQQVLGVKIDKAVDNYDQLLDQSMVANNSNLQGNGVMGMQPRGPIAFSSIAPLPSYSSFEMIVPVRLKKGEKHTKSIKELRGAVSLKIRTPVEDIITVENVLKAKGETAKGKSGATLKIIDVVTEKNGDIKFEVEFQMSNEIQAPPLIAIPQFGPSAPVAVNYLGLELIDAKGISLKLVQIPQQNGRKTVATITYHPEKDQETAKLVLKGTRLAAVDVPFVLKDIAVK